MAYLSPDLVQKALSISSSFAKGGPVAAFQEGGGVNDYESEAYGVGSSVSSTAASEDIGTVDEDRGPGDPPGGRPDDSDDSAPASTPPTEPPPSDDSVVSSLTTEQLENAVDAIQRARNPSAVQQDMLSQARAELKTRAALQTGVDTPTSVTDVATQVDPVDFLGAAGAATDILSGYDDAMTRAGVPVGFDDKPAARGAINYTPEELASQQDADGAPPSTAQGTFDPRISAGIMSDSPQQFDLEQMQLANEIFAKDKLPTSVFPDGRDPQKGAAVVLDRPMQTDRRGVLSKREYEVAEEQAPPSGVDADDMAGIGSVAPRSTVQAPTDGIGAVLTEGYDMAGRPATPPDIYDDDVDQGSADVGALAKELGIDVKDVDFGKRGLANLLEPGGILKDIGGLFTGKGALQDAAAGGQVVKNEEGKTVGVVSYDEEGKVSKVTPVGIKESFDPALKDAYRDFYANQPEERDSGRDEPILPEDVAVEEVEAAPKKPPTIDIIPFRPEDFYYLTQQQRQGLPSMMNMRRS